MMVYNNNFDGKSFDDIGLIRKVYSDWISRKLRKSIGESDIATDVIIRSSRGNLEVYSSGLEDEGKKYAWVALFTHADSSVSGRLWITEFGIRWEASTKSLTISISLRTNEISVNVNEAVQVTRPVLIQMLLDEELLSETNPGIRPKELNNDSIPFLDEEINYPERDYALVIASKTEYGGLHIDPPRLLSKVVGLAELLILENNINKSKYYRNVPKRFRVENGQIRIIFKKRYGSFGDFIENVLIDKDTLERFNFDPDTIENFILSSLAHRYNLPKSWNLINLEVVKSMRYQNRLDALQKSNSTEDINAYKELLDMAAEKEKSDTIKIHSLEEALEISESQSREIASKSEALESAFKSLKQNETALDISNLFNLLKSGEISTPLSTQLKLISTLFHDRVVILDSAFKSAKASDKSGFKYKEKALIMLITLCTDYWSDLNRGMSDSQARMISEKMAIPRKKRRLYRRLGFEREHLLIKGRILRCTDI